jgi:tetratricopeptide (TPR) repeat protein
VFKEDYVMANFNLGRVYAEKGKNIEAAQYYQKALELNEIEPEIDSEDIRERIFHLFDV